MKVILIPLKWFLSRLLGLAQKNYSFAKFYYMFRCRLELKRSRKAPVIIFQMGKVGSTSIKRSLKALNMDMVIYHTHLLTKERINETEKKRKKFFNTERESYLKRPWLNQFLSIEIGKKTNNRKWKVITLTRDPVARNVSSFFENLEVRVIDSNPTFEIGSDYYDIVPTIVTLDDIQVLIDLFFEKFRHDSPLEFFDRELKEAFGIDVYASIFPKSKGYNIYRNSRADVLLIRLEDLNKCAGEAFGELLDIDNFIIRSENVGARKVYAPLYKKFLQTIIWPKSYFDKFYGSKFMNHFYTENEIRGFRENWCQQ
jgi:hypothetical protein